MPTKNIERQIAATMRSARVRDAVTSIESTLRAMKLAPTEMLAVSMLLYAREVKTYPEAAFDGAADNAALMATIGMSL